MTPNITSPAMTTRLFIIDKLNEPTWNEGGLWDDYGQFDENGFQDWFVYVGGKFDEYNNCVICYDSGGYSNDRDVRNPTVQIKCRAENYPLCYGFLSALITELDKVENYNEIVGYEIIGDINDIGQDTAGRYECTLNVIAITNTI